MTRDKAFKLAGAIADAGSNVSVALERGGAFCSVHSESRRFTSDQLARLAEIAAGHGVELWVDGTVQFQQTTKGTE